MLKTHEIFNLLHRSQKFFSITFERRTTRRDETARAGELRTMLCRSGVNKYKRGIISDAQRLIEDFNACILTVWSIDVFMRLRRQGMGIAMAGQRSWRRIDLTKIQKCSILEENELPPVMVQNMHDIRNGFRLANLPPIVEE